LDYKLSQTHEENSLFSPTDGVGCIKNFKYVCSGLLCCVCSLTSLSVGLFLWFIICGWIRFYYWALKLNF